MGVYANQGHSAWVRILGGYWVNPSPDPNDYEGLGQVRAATGTTETDLPLPSALLPTI